jgi:hypothetical protein
VTFESYSGFSNPESLIHFLFHRMVFRIWYWLERTAITMIDSLKSVCKKVWVILLFKAAGNFVLAVQT